MSTVSVGPVLDAGSAVVWMLLKLEMIVAHFVDALWLRLSSTRDAADAVLKVALKQTELAGQQLCGDGVSCEDGRLDGPLAGVAIEGFNHAMTAAVTAARVYTQARAAMRSEIAALKRQHAQVLQAYDDTASAGAWASGDVARTARDLREHAELTYRANRRAIHPRAQAQLADETGHILQDYQDRSRARRAQASLYGHAPIGQLNRRFRSTLTELGDTIRSQQMRS
jgi:hypothetical protein